MNIAWIVILGLSRLGCLGITRSGRLQKRIVSGGIIRERLNAGYEATKWFVWIGVGRFIVRELPQDWSEENEKCGGIVLTPNTVQTACSCMTRGWLGRREGDWNYPLWDGERVDIVVGFNEVENGVQTIPMIKWTFHPLCRKMSGRRQDWVSHDYMLIGSRTPFVESGSITVKIAPTYLIQMMGAAWYRINLNNLVCLMIGMGQYLENQNTKSNVIRHGWRHVANYKECMDLFALDVTNFRLNITEYQAFNTWSCLKVFHFKQPTEFFSTIPHVGEGDMGSPVSCDNIFYGLLGQNQTVTTIVYNAYHNAYEYRDLMQQEFDRYFMTIPPRFQPTMKHDFYELRPEDVLVPVVRPRTYFRNALMVDDELRNAQSIITFNYSAMDFSMMAMIFFYF